MNTSTPRATVENDMVLSVASGVLLRRAGTQTWAYQKRLRNGRLVPVNVIPADLVALTKAAA